MKNLNFLFLLLCFSCASKEILSPDQTKLLFPDGRYRQEAEVSVTANQKPQDFDFNCIIQKSPEELLFFGYNNFGITLFKIHQRANERPEVESSIEQIKNHQDFFLKVFSLVKSIFSIQKDDSRLVNDLLQLNEHGISASVHFSKYDSLGIPRSMLIESTGQYKVEIRTQSFEAMKSKDHH